MFPNERAIGSGRYTVTGERVDQSGTFIFFGNSLSNKSEITAKIQTGFEK